MILEKDGIYRVYKSNLVDSLKKLKNIIKSVDPRTFKVYNKEKKIPIYVHGEEDGKFDKGDYIEFVGMRNPNNLSYSYYHPFNNKNVYWLSWNGKNGLRYSIESAQPTIEHNKAIIPREYKYTEHIEENNRFVRLGRIATDAPAYKKDHWFFDGGIRTGTTRNYSFNLSNPNPYSTSFFSVQAQLHGLTYTGHGHNVTLYINNHLVARGEWEGQRPYTITSEPTTNLQNNFLNTGENNIQIAVEGSYSEDRFDEILFNWLEVEYYRQYRASDDFIEFTPPHDYPEGTYHFPIENFSDSEISVYKIGISKLTNFTIDHNKSQNKYSIILEDKIYSSDTRYFAASKEGIKSPFKIQADTLHGIKNEIPACDLIIITPDKWTNNLIRLTDFYNHKGIIPRLTSLEDIYNEFNHGIASPFAINQYLEYIYKNSTKKFNYVLLIGDAQIRADESILPAFFYQSYRWGACACDHIYTLIDKDSPLPQFAIGRWPCSSSEELEQLINKRINYHHSRDTKSPWHNETLFIAGFENAFKAQSDYLIKRKLSKNLNINRIFINPASQNTPYWGGSESLIEHINSGLSIINFFGHGGGGVWSDRSLFTTEHLPLLENQKKLPFITSMTCFTGDFVNITGLGEDMIKISNGGAIGLFGSSSVGWIQNDYLLCKEIYSHIFQPGLRIGDAIRISKIKYLTSNNYFSYLKKSMAYSYNLLGDPTITLPITQKEIELETSINEPSPGQKIQLSGELPFNQGEGYINLYDLEKYRIPIKPSFYDINSSDFQTEIILPDTIATDELYFNYYFREGNYKNDYIGHTSFHIKGENFYSFKCSPEKPEVNEKINLKIKINHENLDRILCLIDSMGVYKYLDENGIEHVQSFDNNVNIDTLEMTATDEKNCYKLSRPLVSKQPGKLIAVKFVAFTNAGDKTESVVYTIQIKRQPDLRVINLWQTEDNFPALMTAVYSNYEDTLANIELQIRDGQGKLFGSDHFKIYPDIRNELLIKGILGNGRKTFIAEIDPENEIIESNENNNLSDSTFIDVNIFPILPEYGSSYYGSTNDTIKYNRYFSVYIPPGAEQDSAAMQINHNTSQPGLETQPDFEILSQDSIYSYSVNISPPEISKNLYVEFYGIPDSIKNNVSITRWSEKFKL